MSNPPCVMLCASQEELDVSSSFALSADELRSFPWLTICSDAAVARQELRDNPQYQEAWVSSSDEMTGLNLAAAIKFDSPHLLVYLVQRRHSEAVVQRAHAAGLDGVLSPQQLVWRCETHDICVAPGEIPPPQDGGAGEKGAGRKKGKADKDEAPPSTEEPLPSPINQPASLEETAHSGYLLSVMSGSGGAGKSTVAALLAHLAQRRGAKTVVVDGDLRFGDMADLCGTAVRVPIETLAEDAALLSSLTEQELVVIAAPQRLEDAEAVSIEFCELVQRLLQAFDLVVVNAGGSWEEHHAFLLETSMTTLLLVDQRASSIRACRHALDLCLRCGIATGSILLALNHCHKQAPFTAADVSGALQGARVVELREGGCEVEELMGSGLTDALVCSGNPLCQSLDRVLDEIMPSRRRISGAERRVVLGKSQSASRPRRRSRRRGSEGRARRERAQAGAALDSCSAR